MYLNKNNNIIITPYVLMILCFKFVSMYIYIYIILYIFFMFSNTCTCLINTVINIYLYSKLTIKYIY